ncbi:hypothetical protein NLG97_g3365 [Lecanicillium saksenae]|uniref:Uncharacterized protein n=1 Tax=Lecanicillium saksenae TaxID=468837 RepID=A0ACC1R103_9HYPO|nr:hypothetical protein NLG97_g3365 [Lecanicillium saksenae]
MAPSAAAATAHTPLLSTSTPPTTSSSSSSTSTTQTTAPKPRQWNTKNLGMRLGADVVSASCAAGIIAPLIAFIDKYASVSPPIPTSLLT